jgi:threonine-phosphate decarboxylase
MKKHKHGGDIYRYKNCVDFSTNCNPLGVPESVKEAIINSLSHIEEYPQVGYEPLKDAIAAYEGVESEKIICGNGAAELIFSLCRAKKPKRALVAAPTFAEYEQALESVDCQVEHYVLDEADNFSIGEALFSQLDQKPDLLFLCNPNNPTGILTEREFLVKVLKKCRAQGSFLVVDECFLDFVREPGSYTLKEWLKEYPNLFILKAFTKRYAMPGVRLGYGMCGDKCLLEKMEAATQPWNISVMAQAAGIAALQEETYVEEGRKLIFSESAYLKKEMAELGLRVFPSQANYIFFKGPKALFERAVEKGILIRDCSNYEGLGAGYYRICVKKHEENEHLIAVFRESMGGE